VLSFSHSSSIYWRAGVTELAVSVSRDDTGSRQAQWIIAHGEYARRNRDQIDIQRVGT